jgi:hypothetical protein
MVERAARFFGMTVDEWLTVPPHIADQPQVRGTLKYDDRCLALVDGTEPLWRRGRRDDDPDLWVNAERSLRDHLR